MIEKNRRIKAVCSCLVDMVLIFASYLLANYLRFNYIRFFQVGGAGPALDIAQDARTLAAGAVAAFFTGAGWLEQFAIKTPMGWYMFIGGALTVLVLSIAVASYNVLRIAGENPVKSLRSE